MNAQQIMNSEDFKQCEIFHGHVCPGLALGYRAAKSALAHLNETRSPDEELVAIIETDSCGADAVQVLTGCTFGKGNFIFRDYGKMTLTLFSRKTGQGVRVAARPILSPKNKLDLMHKVMAGTASAEEEAQFNKLHWQRACQILEMPETELLIITPVTEKLPPKAQIEPSELCVNCGEKVMQSKLQDQNGQKICRGCLPI